MKYLTLKNGDTLPALGLGTWQAAKGVVAQAVTTALEIGYRHIDCAHVYGNEAEIGDAFAHLSVPRKDLWITSKLWNNSQEPGNVMPALEKTLENLRLDYLDLYLIHWPVQLKHTVMYPTCAEELIPWSIGHMLEIWNAMEACVRKGLVRNIGLSNFSTQKMQAIFDACEIAPAMSQVEIHPCQQQNLMLTFCQKQGMGLTGFAPLGSKARPNHQIKKNEPYPLGAPVILEIAEKHNATPGQVLLAWALTRGIAVIPKSTSEAHLRQNFAAADLELDTEDMQAIAGLDQGYRFIDGSHWMMDGSPYTMQNLWDGE